MRAPSFIALVSCAFLMASCGQRDATSSDSNPIEVTSKQQNERLHMDDFIAKLQGAGFIVSEPKEKMYVMLGASNGAGFDVNGDSIEIYEFDTSITSGRDALERLKTDGFSGQAAEIHKNLAIFVHDKSENTDAAKKILFSM